MKSRDKTADKELKIIQKTRKYMADKYFSDIGKKMDTETELRMTTLLFSFTILEACLDSKKDIAIDALTVCTEIVQGQLESWSEETVSH